VAGRGTYVGDIQLPGMTYLAVLRSPHAHARIRGIDSRAAEALPGVACVVTGAEIREHTRPIPEGWDTAAIGAKPVAWYALCLDRDRYVGEAVAAVVAEDPHVAARAVGLIEVDWEPLPAVVDVDAALAPGAPLVEPEWGDNVRIRRDLRVGDPDAALAAADGVVRGTIVTRRITGVPLEPRGIVARHDPYTDQLTFWVSTQNPHPLRAYLAATLGIPETSIRVIQPQVGGAFGLKQPTFQEEPLIAYLARKLGRPIKWIEERHEHFQSIGHARSMRAAYEAAYRRDGAITALRVQILADIGAPCALVGWGMAFSASGLIPGSYRIPNTRVELTVVVTNTCPWNSYRGFGKDAASLWLERVMDDVARATGRDRAEVRLRNFIPAEAFPYPRPGGGIIDSGDYPRALRRVLELIDYAGFPAVRAEARRHGRFLGLGIGQELSPEGCAMPGSIMISGYDGATVRVAPSGDVTVLAGVTSPGNGNETALAQIAADALGCPLECIRVVQGDTDLCPYGLGNYSSRGVMIGGAAVGVASAEVRDKMRAVAAELLEAAPDDLEVDQGRFFPRGSPHRAVSFREVAQEVYANPFGRAAEGIEPGLEATRYFRVPNVYHQPQRDGRFSAYPTWPSGAAACLVEVDPETGHVRVLRYCLVDDSGTIVNPLLANANLHGALAQAIGGALYEEVAYDETGQLQTATLMDYTIPTAMELPRFEIEHQETPSPFTPLGVKGVGESGMGSALGALCGAIEDAFPDLDVRITELPLTPARVWRAIQAARARRGPAAGAARDKEPR
jgi:carbon-monoxide dehydrogenase large subunit